MASAIYYNGLDPNADDASKRPPIEGLDVRLGYYTYVVPALLLCDLKQALKRKLFEQVKGGVDTSFFTEESIDATLTLLHWSLRRNYPSLTMEDIEQIVDVASLEDAAKAIWTGNKLTARPTPAAPATAPAATPASN